MSWVMAFGALWGDSCLARLCVIVGHRFACGGRGLWWVIRGSEGVMG